jgi:hypothetical protein
MAFSPDVLEPLDAKPEQRPDRGVHDRASHVHDEQARQQRLPARADAAVERADALDLLGAGTAPKDARVVVRSPCFLHEDRWADVPAHPDPPGSDGQVRAHDGRAAASRTRFQKGFPAIGETLGKSRTARPVL